MHGYCTAHQQEKRDAKPNNKPMMSARNKYAVTSSSVDAGLAGGATKTDTISTMNMPDDRQVRPKKHRLVDNQRYHWA